MSSDCVVLPVHWKTLCDEFLPAWIQTIEGRLSIVEYGKRFIRHPEEFGFPDGELLSGVIEIDSAYLKSIGWSAPRIPFPTDRARQSERHRHLQAAGHIDFPNELV